MQMMVLYVHCLLETSLRQLKTESVAVRICLDELVKRLGCNQVLLMATCHSFLVGQDIRLHRNPCGNHDCGQRMSRRFCILVSHILRLCTAVS